ncbi:DUF3868 domain-containing protein [Massilibacteroides sp.]|uniref:DUF3868 domain-containing protein n=1 Tax=Massilibacteroides sp. TaxID=2034766 RepID=UPI0026018AC1|nr:DUF3868 domain-containing protein [Massilibacteroides sp.]MDD4516684.1 DUF3868 domain-containing protein [Massilibacteroides sp.]
MRYIRITIAIVMSTSSIIAQRHEGINILIDQLEKVNQSVLLKYKIEMNTKILSNCESVFIAPFLEKEDSVVYFEPVVINGKSRKNTFKRWVALNYKDQEMKLPKEVYATNVITRRNIVFHEKISYKEWMSGSVLYAKQTVWGCGESVSETVLELGRLIITEPIPEVVIESEPEVKQVLQKEGVAYIDYPIGKSAINLDFGSNSYELSKIGELINDIIKNPDSKITGLIIIGYASPDGPYVINDRLSRERAQTLSQYINTFYKLNLSPSQILIYNVAEDWEGLSKMVEESYLIQKQEVLNILGSVSSFDERKQSLMRLDRGNVYKILKEDFYPKLRKTEYKIIYQTEE